MDKNINDATLAGLQFQTNQLKQDTDELNRTLDELQKKASKLAFTNNISAEAFKENAKAIKDTEKALKEANDEIAKNTKVLDLATGSLKQNKLLLKDLIKTYDEISGKQGDNSKQVMDLNVKIGHLSKAIEDQEKKLKKSREVFDFHEKSVESPPLV